MTETRDQKMFRVLIAYKKDELNFQQASDKMGDLLDEAYSDGIATGEEAGYWTGYESYQEDHQAD
jgi:hypothetical protein